MLKKNKNLKLIGVNFIVFIFLITGFTIFLEILLQLKSQITILRGGQKNIQNIQYCYDEIIKPYSICSFKSITKDVSREDLNYKFVEMHIDSLGGRVKSNLYKKKDPKLYRNFLIGDSFIMASDIPFEKTIQGISRNKLNKSDHIYGIGAGSWNTNQYSQVVNYLIKENAKYNIFLYSNDFTPNFSLTSWRQSKRLFLKIKSFAWIYGKLRPLILNYVNSNDEAFKKVMYQTINTSFDDCSAFKNKYYEKIKKQQRTDHLVFSKHHSCWPKVYKLSVDHSLDELINIGNIINSRNSSIRYFIVPISFAYKNENTKGRDYFLVPSSESISQKGLNEYILENLPFYTIDLEPVIRKEILKIRKDCPQCLNQFYLKYSAHWNSKAHEFIYKKYFQ